MKIREESLTWLVKEEGGSYAARREWRCMFAENTPNNVEQAPLPFPPPLGELTYGPTHISNFLT